MGDFATRVELNKPRQCGIDKRMVRRATSKEEVRIGGQIEATGFAIAFGKLDEELAAVFFAEPFEHLVDLRAPGGVALTSFQELRQISAAYSEAPEVVEILHRQIGLRAPCFGAGGERDATEDAAGARRRR